MRNTIWLLLILFFCLAGSVDAQKRKPRSKKRAVRNTTATETYQSREPRSFAYAIKQSGWVAHPLYVTSPRRIYGRYEAQGGTRNDVEVFILDADGMTNFRNGNTANTYFNSGNSQTVGNIDVFLQPGTYYLVFKNPGWWAARAVNLTLYQY